jgi:hypothetical protein
MITFSKGDSVATVEPDTGPANAEGNETFTVYINGARIGINRVFQEDLPRVFASLVDQGYRLDTSESNNVEP